MSVTKPKILSLLYEIAKEQNHENPKINLTPISSDGANFTSTLHVATVTSNKANDLNLFIKVAAMGEKMRSFLKVYEVETFVYTKLQGHFRRLEDKNGISERDRLKMPKYYGSSSIYMEEIIVLENLVSKGFTTQDRMTTVNWEYTASTVAELAKLHALSMALEDEDPEEFAKLLQFLKLEVTNAEETDMFLENTKISTMKVVRKENVKKLEKCLDGFNNGVLSEYLKASKREVLMHGDFRPSNMMHRTRVDESVEVVPVDYQTIRGGSPVIDLLYFIFTATDKQFRAQYYQQLTDLYYSELNAALKRLGLKPDEKYSKRDFNLELKEKIMYGLAVGVYTLPSLTVEADLAPAADQTLELASFVTREPGRVFSDRVNGIIDDYVRWGLL